MVATRGQEFSTEKRGFLAPSTVRPGVFDQALYTMDYFAAMLRTEEKALKLITLKRKDKLADVAWGGSDATSSASDPPVEAGTTLYDLVSLASRDRVQAPRLLYDFVAELRLSTEVPVAIMIDNLNIWDQVCEFVEPHTYKPMDPRKLALVDAFSYFTRAPPVRKKTNKMQKQRGEKASALAPPVASSSSCSCCCLSFRFAHSSFFLDLSLSISLSCISEKRSLSLGSHNPSCHFV